MIEIYLPYFFDEFYFNEFFYYITKTNKDKLKLPLVVTGAYGNFPYTPANGGFNNNDNYRPLYNDYVSLSDTSSLPIIFDFSNLYLNKYDYDDTVLNLILSLNNSGSNSILLSSMELHEKIKKEYNNNYHFIFSSLINFLYPIDSNVINELTQKIDYVELPFNFIKDDLKNIKNKKQIIVPIGLEPCSSCKKIKQCIQFENSSCLNFSIKSSFLNCNKIKNYDDNYLIEQIQFFKNLGFSKFKLAISSLKEDRKKQYEDFLIKSFFKNEFHNEILEESEKNINENKFYAAWNV